MRQDVAKLARVSICRLSILLSSFRSRFRVFYGASSFQEPITCIIAIPFQRATKVAPDHQRQNRYLPDISNYFISYITKPHFVSPYDSISLCELNHSVHLPRSPPNSALDPSKCLRQPIHHQLDGSSRGNLSHHQPSTFPPASPDLSSQLLAEISSSYPLFPATTPVIQLLLSRDSPLAHRHQVNSTKHQHSKPQFSSSTEDSAPLLSTFHGCSTSRLTDTAATPSPFAVTGTLTPQVL